MDQLIDLLPREPLFLIYGVAGIGKSELVYELVDRVRGTTPWRDAEPLLFEVQPHHSIERVVTLLAGQLSEGPGHGSDHRVAGHELACVARFLDQVPRLLFLDDAHHLDPEALGGVLGYLSRQVRSSRILVASRREIVLPTSITPPVVMRLATLDERETGELVTALARKLGIAAPEPAAVFRRSSGSPFFVQRHLVELARTAGSPADSLEQSLRELPAGVREFLLVAAVIRDRIEASRLCTICGDGETFLREAEQRFLVTVERGAVVVHDLVRDALLRVVDAEQMSSAHRRAGELHLARFLGDAVGSAVALIEAVHCLTAAGDAEAAWQLVEDWYPRISAAGLDHLLREDLDTLVAALPGHRAEILLFIARILLRRSHMDDAQEVLRRIDGDLEVTGSYRFLLLSGEVAQRAGRLEEAGALFRQAREVAVTAVDRFHSGLQLAGIASLRGDGIEARRLLEATLGELALPSPRHRGRYALHLALSYTIEERHQRVVEVAAQATPELEGRGLGDIVARLAMFEILARVELDQLGRARQLAAELAADDLARRGHLESLSRSAVLVAEGRARAAVAILEPVFAELDGQREQAYACLAGQHLAGALLMLGQVAGARAIAKRVAALARSGELTGIHARTALCQAGLLLSAGDLGGVHAEVTRALTSFHLSTVSIVHARSLLARIHAATGDSEACAAELARAEDVAGDDHPALCWRIRLERAESALLLGDAETAIAVGEQVHRYYRDAGRVFEQSRAGLAVAGGYLVRGGLAGQLLAERVLERSCRLALDGGYQQLLARVAIVQAALLTQRGEPARGLEILADALHRSGDEDTAEVRVLRAVLQQGSGPVPLGINLMLSDLAPRPASRFRMVGALGSGSRRVATDHDVEHATASCDLVVDLVRGTIAARHGEVTIKGKPVTTRLLAALVERQPQAVSAETLYREVWRAAEYHSLRHRNTVYVALNRLRRTLFEVFPGRQMIEKAPEGWRMADDVAACVVCDAGRDRE